MYGFMEEELGEQPYANGEEFSMSDCAATPALFYAQRAAPFDSYKNIANGLLVRRGLCSQIDHTGFATVARVRRGLHVFTVVVDHLNVAEVVYAPDFVTAVPQYRKRFLWQR